MTESILFGLVSLGAATTLAVLVALVARARALAGDRELLALERPVALETPPRVSVIVPARDEERNVAACVESLRGLDYPDLEIVVADDGSTDRTVVVARAAAGDDPRVRVLTSDELEPAALGSWRSGKSRVLWAAVPRTRGAWILFVDADTRQRPDGLWRAMAFAGRHGLEALSVSGRYVNEGFWGEILEAVLYTPVFLSIPLERVNDPSDRALGWINGQFVLVERRAYLRSGGHQRIGSFSVEDVALGHLFKRRGVRYRFLPAAALYDCENYRGLGEAHRGWSRNVATGTSWLGRGRGFLLGVIAAILLAGVLPFAVAALLAAGAIDARTVHGLPLGALALGQAGFAIVLHGSLRRAMGLPAWKALLLPIGCLLAVRTFVAAYRLRFGTGRIDFRGRPVEPDDPRALDAVAEAGS